MTDPNILLCPELREIAQNWSATKRSKMAEKLANWSNQLSISAIMMAKKPENVKNPPYFPCGVFLKNPRLN
jgi:hypothetical protein